MRNIIKKQSVQIWFIKQIRKCYKNEEDTNFTISLNKLLEMETGVEIKKKYHLKSCIFSVYSRIVYNPPTPSCIIYYIIRHISCIFAFN